MRVPWFFQQLGGLVLAIRERHHWIRSPRARALEEWTVRMSVLLHYTAYLLFAWLAYRLWVGVPQVVAKVAPIGLFVARDSLDFRSSLIIVFAGAFLVPAGLFVIRFVVKWTCKLIEAAAHRRQPRFMRLPFYPLVLCGAALVGMSYRQPVADDNSQTEKLAGDLLKQYEGRGGQQPPRTARAGTRCVTQ